MLEQVPVFLIKILICRLGRGFQEAKAFMNDGLCKTRAHGYAEEISVLTVLMLSTLSLNLNRNKEREHPYKPRQLHDLDNITLRVKTASLAYMRTK